ncbi:MAG: penicillin-binding protein 1A [bacterium]
MKTTIVDRHGTPISELFQENRLIVSLRELPKPLIDAFLATEDARFHEHWGVSVLDTFRAIVVNIREGRKAQGGSTITQQLVRNLFLTHDKAFTRKIKEALLAVEIESMYTKDEILEMYLNQIYFGHGAYGVESASHLYFGKPAKDLVLSECATLAGIPKNPSGYSPLRHPEASIARARVVLQLMADAGVISRNEMQIASDQLQPLPNVRRKVREAPYFIEAVRQDLLTRYDAETIYGGGLRIYTTLDLAMQHVAEDVVEARLSEMEERRGFRRDHASFSDEKDRSSASDSSETQYVQGALVAIDPSTGDVLAMVGGRDFTDSHFNRATQAKRQPGSAFKVFVYAAGVESGMTAGDICVDEPITIPVPGSEDYKPRNYDGLFRGEVLVRDALAHSVNVPAVRMLLRFGPKATIECARRLGVTSPLRAVPSLALGSFEVTLMEMTSAFAVFADGGIRATPRSILRVEDRDGHVLEESKTHLVSALDPKTAYIMTSLLESVINEGTAAKARSLGLHGAAAGKTGTPDDYTDGWFVGYTPEVACGVWVGFDRKEKIGEDQTGAKTALPIWTDFITGTGHANDAPFPRPEGIVNRQICIESGGLATERCERTRSEVYILGTEPSLVCQIHAPGRADGTLEPSEATETVVLDAGVQRDESRAAIAHSDEPADYAVFVNPRPSTWALPPSIVRRETSRPPLR